ncbi:Pisatin demethylase [Diplogelasinospora grovesii]|uniref:Pisatin demethylase n=1 Tax=Diplogelasinospora grovesii TaxID=303347 RepID=A0AAN6S522_9PEZI|nr:Pisatin demethylase [Diplogelasinospora grovesii]
MDSLGSHVDSLGQLSPSLLTLDVKSVAGLATLLVVVPLATVFGWFALSYFTSPLRKYPGPFLAGWTNLWRLYIVQTGDYQNIIKKLHEKYGPVVRIGPNLLDLDYPEVIKTIYSTDGKWRKTEFYHNNSAVINGKITYHLFSTTDQAEHARMKRPIVKYYSLGSVLALEPHMDKVINDFCQHLEQRFMTGPGGPKECDLGEWIAFYAWDLISSATFSRRFGYMDKGHDFDQTIATADKSLDYFATVGQMPFLDFLMDKNPIMRIGPPNLSNITGIALNSLVARLQGKDENYDAKIPDFMQHFIESKNTHPDLVNDGVIMGYLLVNLLAGADTTAITLRAIFYFGLHNPSAWKKLEAEIAAAGFPADQPAPYNAARALPFLEAVCREAMRMHPGVGMLLERYVPAGGLTLPDGSYVPQGAAVGLNPYVIGRNKSVWGEDADEFRPERWLQNEGEDDEAYKARLQKWNAADLTFGNGSRVCIGRNLALVEVYKIVATLVSRYEVELVDPKREWKVTCSWFPRQTGVICKLRKRN